MQQIELRASTSEAQRLQIDLTDECDLLMIDVEREFINDLYSRGEIKAEARRRIERELDLRDAALANIRDTGLE